MTKPATSGPYKPVGLFLSRSRWLDRSRPSEWPEVWPNYVHWPKLVWELRSCSEDVYFRPLVLINVNVREIQKKYNGNVRVQNHPNHTNEKKRVKYTINPWICHGVPLKSINLENAFLDHLICQMMHRMSTVLCQHFLIDVAWLHELCFCI